jgi:hypothetical protein
MAVLPLVVTEPQSAGQVELDSVLAHQPSPQVAPEVLVLVEPELEPDVIYVVLPYEGGVET